MTLYENDNDLTLNSCIIIGNNLPILYVNEIEGSTTIGTGKIPRDRPQPQQI
jgi:hypothetical protein